MKGESVANKIATQTATLAAASPRTTAFVGLSRVLSIIEFVSVVLVLGLNLLAYHINSFIFFRLSISRYSPQFPRKWVNICPFVEQLGVAGLPRYPYSLENPHQLNEK